MRGLDPRIHQKRETVSKKMDCLVKPGKDELRSEPAFADQHGIAPTPLLRGEKNKAIRR
jgi:hypothetical protein